MYFSVTISSSQTNDPHFRHKPIDYLHSTFVDTSEGWSRNDHIFKDELIRIIHP